jgi:hypothetical protein
MMLREIITPTKASFTIRLPEEMIGKTVEVIAFEVTDAASTTTKSQRMEQLEELTKSSLVDLSDYKFNREEANDFPL